MSNKPHSSEFQARSWTFLIKKREDSCAAFPFGIVETKIWLFSSAITTAPGSTVSTATDTAATVVALSTASTPATVVAATSATVTVVAVTVTAVARPADIAPAEVIERGFVHDLQLAAGQVLQVLDYDVV